MYERASKATRRKEIFPQQNHATYPPQIQVADISQLRHYKINETPGTNFDTGTTTTTTTELKCSSTGPDCGKKVSGKDDRNILPDTASCSILYTICDVGNLKFLFGIAHLSLDQGQFRLEEYLGPREIDPRFFLISCKIEKVIWLTKRAFKILKNKVPFCLLFLYKRSHAKYRYK